MVVWLQQDWFSLFCRMILQYVLNISVIQCEHFKKQINVYGSSWDRGCFMNFRLNIKNSMLGSQDGPLSFTSPSIYTIQYSNVIWQPRVSLSCLFLSMHLLRFPFERSTLLSLLSWILCLHSKQTSTLGTLKCDDCPKNIQHECCSSGRLCA